MDAHDVVVARKFVLVDEEGNPRAALMAESDGLVGLHIQDAEGAAPLISIGLEEEQGTPYVVLRRLSPDGSKRGAVLLGVSEEGDAALRLEDANGRSRTYTT